ncbi:stage II sporulation protein M [Paenibacillus naphthalenovorans]|uniref:Stage II sporulation protein M n=1 Tax=Paenibacillus naphthalenovorans TaxID=162209 RepID=A0A0U2IMI8_9BACL|nr:stage II sporulation protein M [Paenibacillus naphthalenovorans]ALS22763.1 stage II sporulation protein M [Paenibacillus naphthalenovorans]GCL70558.1 stage II sporulation protein M [Paenibacillus naphthalenovorans]SDH78458.1 stage II sporulation protein M [Paenibacillus naphthalenovorans]
MLRNRTLEQYMKEHLSLYIFVGVIFVTGVVFGAVMVNALSLEQKQEITRYLGNFFSIVTQGGLESGTASSIKESFTMHIKWVLIIWLLGLSVIGLPLILILDFLKGVLIGFSVGYMVGTLSWKGLLFALVSVVPQNLIVIPLLIICSVSAISFSILLVKNRFISRKGTLYEPFMRLSGTILASGFMLIGVAVFEAHVSPVMMKWVAPMLITMPPS